MNILGSITSISDIAGIIDSLKDIYEKTSAKWPVRKFLFGVWFRGQADAARPLQPTVYREKAPGEPSLTSECHDETNLFDHLQLRSAHYQQTYRSAFEWLCLMQHYTVPTRLLDWSESILPALYFAVSSHEETDGAIFVLNARQLNENVDGQPLIYTSNNPGVIIRSEIAQTRSSKILSRQSTVIEAARIAGVDLEDLSWLEKYRKPIAVFPSRSNDRMIFQSSVFTLHGGKMYRDDMKGYYIDELIPSPISLEDIDKEVDILKMYTVPQEYKNRIKEQLFILGVHEGTLFPEIDRQATYLRQLW